ncbi:MAG: ABC transporter ATP-binding protein [Myxococcota bacterium]
MLRLVMIETAAPLPKPLSARRALTLSRVCVDAGRLRILHNLGLSLAEGELCGVIGPSGAGKSTLFKVLLGLRQPSTGTVLLGGGSLDRSGPIGYVPQDDALHRTLTVEQELRYAAALRMPAAMGPERSSVVEKAIRQVGLEERRETRISKLSGGQRKRVSVALELLTSPGLLILDEPTSGLDPGLESKMMGLFRTLAEDGRIVLVATHAMQSLSQCHRLLVIVKGRMAFFGSPEEAHLYFGVKDHGEIFDILAKRPAEAWGDGFRGGAR